MRHKLVFPALIVILGFPPFSTLISAQAASSVKSKSSAALPLSASPKALRLMDRVWKLNSDEVEQEKGCVVLRKIVSIDPNFAVAHELLAQFSLDPAEQVSEQRKAVESKHFATPAEQLLVEWFQAAADHDLLPAISDMNELLGRYPHDRWVVMLANFWLTQETQYERAAEVFENSGLTSPGMLNNAAYTYAYMRQFDKAFALMEQYVAAMPKVSNPQDSYAEILRMAGHYNQAIVHYRAALAINPNFYMSQFGIADTYALMGQEARARQEYELGFHKFPMPALHQVQWRNREAFTYIWEGDLKGADQAFQSIADFAHSNKMGQVEADTYRQMAQYQPDPVRALGFLDKAETAIQLHENAMAIAVQQEEAQILRARVEVAVKQGDQESAKAALDKLNGLSQVSSDKLIATAYHAAAGALLFSQHKYTDAISHLEEDTDNPLSLRLLTAAYQKSGNLENAKHMGEVLASLNVPTLEQAMIVPAFRECIKNASCDAATVNASLK
ncbi:MAG TPA: hypothetical protein VFO39_14895 [Candidatus Sulfotelmatobacter sp.]|nr:hypothetical protein [Candidatus Sulfotelmatobacter sp.]